MPIIPGPIANRWKEVHWVHVGFTCLLLNSKVREKLVGE